MKIASWNVNSIRAREQRVLGWLERHRPDVVCLQETKVEDALFPALPLRQLGYHAAVRGQRSYNGVAILAREPPEVLATGLGEGDREARLLDARAGPVRVICAYVPNGQEVGSEAFAAKLDWLGRLRRHLDERCEPGELLLVAGDFNVAPAAIDVYDPAAYQGQLHFHPDEHAALGRVTDWGLLDLVRERHLGEAIYSWWDYRQLAFPKNRGLRIDLALATAPLAARCTAAFIDREARKGPKPSDHAPVVVEIE